MILTKDYTKNNVIVLQGCLFHNLYVINFEFGQNYGLL